MAIAPVTASTRSGEGEAAFGHVALAFEAEAAVGEDFHAAGGELGVEDVGGGEDDTAGCDGIGGNVPELGAAWFP